MSAVQKRRKRRKKRRQAQRHYQRIRSEELCDQPSRKEIRYYVKAYRAWVRAKHKLIKPQPPRGAWMEAAYCSHINP